MLFYQYFSQHERFAQYCNDLAYECWADPNRSYVDSVNLILEYAKALGLTVNPTLIERLFIQSIR